MKSILFTSLLFFIINTGFAQTTPAEQLALLQATKMKDSVGLSNVQKQAIYVINMDIHQRKQSARSAFANNPVQLQVELQSLERQRDSLYRPVFTNEEQYQLYKSKKGNILKAN